MASVNKAILVGHLGRDPEMKYMPSGDALCSFSIATSDTWKDKQGVKQERTEWHRISIFGKLAEIAGEYLKKGSSCYIEGRIQTRKWQDKDGNDKFTTEIVADRMQMLGGKVQYNDDEQKSDARQPAQSKPESNGQKAPSGFDDFESDIPF